MNFKNFIGYTDRGEKSLKMKERSSLTFLEYLHERTEYMNSLKDISKILVDYEKHNWMFYELNFTNEQKHEIFEVIRNSENAQNNLKQLVESNLQNQYSFEQIKELITKDEKKKKIKMNF